MNLFSGCETRTNEPPKVKNKKKKDRKKEVDNFSKISGLKKSNRQTFGLIRFLNDTNPTVEEQPIIISGENIKIKGVAIDKHQEDLAAGVYIKAGNEFYKADYGQPNKIVVAKMENPKYLRSGFTLNIPTKKLKKGINQLGLLVLSSDGASYYEQKNKIRIKVK